MDSEGVFVRTTDHALLYSKYRPDTPAFIMDIIIKYFKQECDSFGHAIDIACGTGQSTKPLVKHFNKVTGVDISEAQISQASKSIPEATFVIGPGENLHFIGNESIDLVTICSGFHWIDDKDKFFSEVKRVLKPSGVIVVYAITLYEGIFCEDEELTATFKAWDKEYIRNYLNPRSLNAYQQYLKSNIPFKDVQIHEVRNTENLTPDQFLCYITTLYPYHMYMKQNPGKDILQELKQRLTDVLQQRSTDSKHLLKITWPAIIVLGRK